MQHQIGQVCKPKAKNIVREIAAGNGHEEERKKENKERTTNKRWYNPDTMLKQII